MDKKTTAQEIGARIRKFRMLNGWSQRDLGDMIGTTSAAISKYEKEVHDIEVIKDLSKALEVDLLNDEMDQEGEIGEIGLEIISIIIADSYDSDETSSDGYMDAKELLSTKDLYGLSIDKRIHELAKLEKMGLCVREQFTDFQNKANDYVFITAKGVIAFKRRMPDLYSYDNIKTHELYCHGYDNVQEYIDHNQIESILEQNEFNTSFRYNFYAFLAKELIPYDFMERPLLTDYFFNGVSCYENILFSMMVNFTREEADIWHRIKNCFNYFALTECAIIDANDYLITDEEKMLFEKVKDTQEYIEYNCYQGISFDEVESEFIYFLESNINEKFRLDDDKEYDHHMENDVSDDLKNLLELREERRQKIENIYYDYMGRLKKIKEVSVETDVRKLFSKEQIEEWVNKNIRMPANEHEEKLQKIMRIVLDEYPFAKNYFYLPKEWEKNGLADLVWDAYGVLDIMKKYPNDLGEI